MATEMKDCSDEEYIEKPTLDVSTQTVVGSTANNHENFYPQLPSTREINEIELSTQVGKPDEDAVDADQKCPICLGAWTDSGSHRLCALRCGHMFGYECIKRWLDPDKKIPGRCPQCKARASTSHIRFLYTNKVSSRDHFRLSKMEQQLKLACLRRLQMRIALIKQKQKTRKYKKMYKASVLALKPESEDQNQL